MINAGIENVRSQGNSNNTEDRSFVYVKDIEKDILVNKDGLRHSLTRKPDITAKVTMQIGDILKNAIIINELNQRGTTSGGYVLIGIGVDEDNNYYPTRIIVNNYEVNDIENLDVVYAIISKKKNQY